jgi:hypothetical protein
MTSAPAGHKALNCITLTPPGELVRFISNLAKRLGLGTKIDLTVVRN